ncbi:pentatricopeptide repeat-containing protein At2g29760, chloroplastic-like [Magnolia sinica]|uniref:pentatricopeptide repeat-containing protein At2g29760, chloroplastic-like n=1 Tax=Magnolia sinica TaxID=86752 RepID=UPI002658266E|nr:pentatricopeptide repeat-containing protein At2g29760, chloroplastic-like [Magnolia sinica]
MEAAGKITKVAVSPLESLHQHHHHSNPTTLSLFNGCDDARQIHARLIKTKNAHNNFYLSKLLSRFIQSNHIHEARLLFDHAKRPNTLVWNTLLKGYVDSGLFLEALLLFKKMRREGISPDSYTLPFVLKACGGSGTDVSSIGVGTSVHSVAVKSGLDDNLFVQNSAIDMYCRCLMIESARKLFDEMSERDLVSWTSMISGYAGCGDMEIAKLLFGSMGEKDIVSWGAMISGFVRNGCPDEALFFFREMQLCGVQPGEVAIVSALSACASLGLRSMGLWLHGFVVRRGLELTAFMGTSLIDMYGKCGDVDNARQVFESMPETTLASWNSMIGGLAMNGRTEEALSTFSDMEKAGIKPNSITLSSVLCACRHGGLVEVGHYYFEHISKEYNISTNLDHYGCMVDLLGRAGYVNEAYELIKTMPFEPNEVIWGALLGACKIHGNLKLGEHAIEWLVELDPHNSGNYVLLSNMYATLGRSEDVERVRAEMREMGVEKPRGCSSIEVNSIVHEFYAGDHSHTDVNEVYEKLTELYCKMEELGYQPSVDLQMYSVESY